MSARRSSSTVQAASTEEIQAWAKERVESILKGMLHELFKAKPDDPVDFMITYLQEYQERTSGASRLSLGGGEEAPPPTALAELPVIDTGGPSRYNRGRRRVAVSAEPVGDGDGDGDSGEGGAEASPVIPKSEEDRASIVRAVSGNILFSSLEDDEMSVVVDAMEPREYAAGEYIIRQGEDGDRFYVLDRGECDCYVLFPGAAEPRLVKQYGPGQSFGELALMYNCPRAASIVATSPVRTWVMGRTTFHRVLMRTTSEKRRHYDEFLQRVPLLEGLDRAERAKIADALQEVHFGDGDCIIAQGDAGETVYLIREGAARVTKALPGVSGAQEVMRYGAGDFFGELALLNDKPRAASVFAVGPTTCVCLDRAAFNRLLGPVENIMKRKQDTYANVDRAVVDRVVNTRRRRAVCAESPADADSGAPLERVVHPKTPEQEASIRRAISGNFLFSSLDSEQLRIVLDAMFERSFAAGEFIIRQGDDGDLFYVLDQGECDCFVKMPGFDPPGRNVKHYSHGQSFGELALMYNCPRAASIVASTPVRVWCMDRQTFHHVIMTTSQQRARMYESFLARVPLLASLSDSERSRIADALEPVEYDDGALIIRQGDPGDAFYFVVSGQAVATKRLEAGDAEEQVVFRYEQPGAHFGELALLNDKPRAANVRAVGHCKCARMDRAAFVRLLGPCEDILSRNQEQYAEIETQLRRASSSGSLNSGGSR